MQPPHIRVMCALAIFALWFTPAMGQNRVPVGVNLEVHSSFASQIIFADAMKRALPWVSINFPYDGQWNTGVEIPLDADGYPLELPYQPPSGGPAQIVGTFLFNGMEGRYPAGTYTLIFEGAGLLNLSGANGDQFFTQAGTYPITVDPTQGNLYLEIVSSNAQDPIRNIRLILPGHEQTYQTQPFYQPLIDRLQSFSAVRLMQTMRTNGGDYPCDNGVPVTHASCVKRWAQRPQSNYYTQATSRGVALEYLIDLANTAGINLWLNIPHGADDPYIQEVARLVRQRLASSLSVYIELSNELWNFSGDYPQANWARAAGLAQGLDADPEHARRKFVVKRSADMFHLFKQEFGSQHGRVVNVLPGVAPDAWTNDQMLHDLNDPNINPNAVQAHALAVGGYIGGLVLDEAVFLNEANQLTPADLLNRLRANITIDRPDPFEPGDTIPSLSTIVQSNKAVADAHGVDFIAYEGGQYLVENQGPTNHQNLGENAVAANRDAEMYHVYRDLMTTWETNGGGLFMHYSLVRRPSWMWGSFGALEWVDQPLGQAHKYRALLDYIEGR